MARYPKGTTPKLTTNLIEEVCKAIRLGAYIETAAALCGISKDTFYRWLKRGKEESGSSIEKKLSDAVLKALAESEVSDLEVIDKAAKHNNGWKAAAWRLERRFPTRWGKAAEPEADTHSRELHIHFIDPQKQV